MSEFGSYSRGQRFFTELKGVKISKVPGTETWEGSGPLGGLMSKIRVTVAPTTPGVEAAKKVEVTSEMWGLRCEDLLIKVGPLWVGEHVYVKTASNGDRYVNLKTKKSFETQEEEW